MKQILDESTRDNLLLPYVNLINQNGGSTNVSQLKQYLLISLILITLNIFSILTPLKTMY